MKKSILIFCLGIITLSLTAFAVINWNNMDTENLEVSVSNEMAINTPVLVKMKQPIFTDFIYEVGTRFSSIKKSDIDKARSIDDFLDKEVLESIINLKSVSIIIIKNDRPTDIQETGYTKALTPAQLKLLQSFDYSTNFVIRADFQEKNKVTGKLEYNYTSPYLTIVPEKQATFVNGEKALKRFLKESSMEARKIANVEPEKLQPAKLYFTVTKNGAIENVRLDRTSNYPLVDEVMIKLIKETQGKWKPAENFKGEKIDQELVASFGLMGC